ncbi:hypothetical protein [uncultured Muribaculum sp.]|uniref:hypothetical protein n=1 Tax=uncultured Muribaculum sp. TaxID=1918613 RepID=UPI0026047726|nr:hypothetical protein [uncultured Muribaculum sp.]
MVVAQDLDGPEGSRFLGYVDFRFFRPDTFFCGVPRFHEQVEAYKHRVIQYQQGREY